MDRLNRPALWLSICVLALGALAGTAAADEPAPEWVIVVDADEVDAAKPEALPAPVPALVKGLAARGIAHRFVAARHPLTALTSALPATEESEEGGDDDKDPPADDEAPAEDEAKPAPPLRLVLVGAFDKGITLTSEEKDTALATWHTEMPKGSLILPMAGVSGFALSLLEGAIGLVDGAWIVLDAGTPKVTTQPFSVFGNTKTLRADVHVPLTTIRSPRRAAQDTATYMLTPAGATEGDDSQAAGQSAEGMDFVVTRPFGGSRDGTLSFGAPADEGRVFLLCDLPKAVTWRWDDVLPEYAFKAADGGEVAAFEALDVEVPSPVEHRYRLIWTRTLKQRPEVRIDRVVPGLRAWIDGDTRKDADTFEATIHVRFAARAATPVPVTNGRIEVALMGSSGSPGWAFSVSAPGGTAVLEPGEGMCDAPLPQGDAPVERTLRVVPTNGNMPKTTPLTLACTPEAYANRLRLRVTLEDGTERRVAPGSAFEVPVGSTLTVRAELADAASWALLDPGHLAIRPGTAEGVIVEGEQVLRFRFRRARLVASPEAPSYKLEDGKVTPIEPLRLRMEADDGNAAWLLARMREAPVVTEQGDDPVSAWSVVDEGQGVWRVEAEGDWSGPDAAVFADDFAGVTFQVAWGGGDVPKAVIGTVEVPARWGTKGWIVLALAVLALGLGIGTFLQLRAAPVRGTLLYAVQGMERTVGRLDLNGIGRRAVVLSASLQGRLSIDGDGDPIATIRPTRVGAMLTGLDVEDDPSGRLLVDGLSMRTGKHTLRYVSGETTAEDHAALQEVPDLLGPEYDLGSGTVDALPESTTEPIDPESPRTEPGQMAEDFEA